VPDAFEIVGHKVTAIARGTNSNQRSFERLHPQVVDQLLQVGAPGGFPYKDTGSCKNLPCQ
jgi:hypothetical protein